MKLHLAGLGFLTALLPLFAEDSAAEGGRAAREVRFLPIGDAPPFRSVERDGVRYELEPPPGTIPPREVMVGFDDDDVRPVPLILGRVTRPIKAPGGSGPLFLRRGDGGDEEEPWLKVARPEDGDMLVLLWRASAKGTWADAKALVLADGRVAAPAGCVRMVNLSPVTVGVVFGEEKIALLPGKMILRTVAAGREVEFQLGAIMSKEAARPTRFHSGVVFQNPGERTMVVIYRADGEKPRRPLKAIVEREPVPSPKHPPVNPAP